MGFSGKFYILHCPSKVYLTSLMGKWMRVVEVSTFQLLLMNLTKLCTNFISTPQRTLPPSLPVFFPDKTNKSQSLPFPLFYISSQMRDPVFATLASPNKYVTLYN